MKYKTFRAIVVVGVGGLAFGLGYLLFGGGSATRPLPPPETASPSGSPATPGAASHLPPGVTTQPTPDAVATVRPMDVEIIAAAAANIIGDKVKDAIPGRPWKVNLYRDGGATQVNRAKIDLDRDDKWDEKWSWEPEGLQRQIAPADDEQYTVVTWFHPALNAWTAHQPGTAPAPSSAATAGAPAGAGGGAVPQRPMDVEIMAAAAANISGDKVKDAIRGRPWKVNLYREAGAAQVNRLKIDLDRDDKWDEKWSLEHGAIERAVAPADDENYTETTYWRPDLKVWTRTKPGVGAAMAPAEAPVAPTAPAGSPVETSESPAAGEGAGGTSSADAPALPAGEALRPMDREILALVATNPGGDKLKDAIKGRAWKVNLYRDAGKSSVNRAKVDLDRDDQWDEKWTWNDDGIVREIAPADDEVYRQRTFLPIGGTAWLQR